ncbi:hypothetical protein [Actinomyces qiguomingii]|uniref:hypothetical protein n=1 Tax=Actinomyces qiguomingii TaxID=2057800 RepID=UPI000FFE8269|nr:hypothetical protein [Actinomyces qiguomingii]
MLRDSSSLDRRFLELLNNRNIEDIDTDSPASHLIRGRLRDPRQLPNDQLFHPAYYLDIEEPRPVSEHVITSVGVTYRDLAELLTDHSSPTSSCVTIDDLKTILDHASRIQHRQTRKYAVDQVADAVIQATIISRHENEELGADTLSVLVPSLPNRSRIPGPVPRESADVQQPEAATYRSTTDLIHDVVLRRLRDYPTLDPAARTVLLGFVDDTEVLANILYTLLYADESHRLRAQLLHPFLPYTRRIYLGKEERGRHRERVARLLLEGTGISHRVNAEVATWLVDLLGRPLTLNELKDVGTAPRLFRFSWLSVVLWWALLTPTTPLYTEFFTDAQLEALDASGWGDETRGRDAVLEAISILTELGEDRKASQLQFMIRRARRPPNGESPKSTPT